MKHQKLYKKFYEKFRKLNIPEFHVVERFLRSFTEGYVNEEDKKYFDAVETKILYGKI